MRPFATAGSSAGVKIEEPMTANRDRLLFKFFRVVEGEAEGRFAISALVALVLLLCAVSLAGCAPRPDAYTSAMSARKMAVSQQFQKDWERCVDASYQVIRQQTPDKSAAAERAFASCATEEDQMNSVYDRSINAMVMPHFKAEAKRLLVERGYVSPSPGPQRQQRPKPLPA
jgi:hypothetical protein